jgi:gluconate 2-dehydrogenase alpha chain
VSHEPNGVSPAAMALARSRRHNLTGTVGALAYWSAEAIREQNLKHPGPLVHA